VLFGPLDWSRPRSLDFEPPDVDAFPCLALAYQAGRMGGTAPACLNAANEVAVAAFLDSVIPWSAIAEVIKDVLEEHDGTTPNTVDVVIDADRWARERARRAVQQRAR
jgi:1-deoxy-D-xylulose-5-phosphate reductoisomerase